LGRATLLGARPAISFSAARNWPRFLLQTDTEKPLCFERTTSLACLDEGLFLVNCESGGPTMSNRGPSHHLARSAFAQTGHWTRPASLRMTEVISESGGALARAHETLVGQHGPHFACSYRYQLFDFTKAMHSFSNRCFCRYKSTPPVGKSCSRIAKSHVGVQYRKT
jgi:hypothetical protein